MKFILAVFLILTAISCHAQTIEVGYSPASFTGIGSLPKTTKINISFLYPALHSKRFHYLPGIRYARVNSKNKTIADKTGHHVDGTFNMLFVLPASFNVTLGKFAYVNRMGFGLSGKSFPNKNGRYQNFMLEAGFSYAISRRISISARYSHISNGWRGTINPGLDSILIAAGFHL